MATKADLQIFDDRQALARGAAEQVAAIAKNTIAQHQTFRLVLSGGSTPRAMHQVLSQPEYSEQIDWPHVQIFWGDERCVPPDNPYSNFRMAKETLLQHIPIPAGNIHRIYGELPPQQAAADYQSRIADQFNLKPDQDGGPLPRFDLILLGLGLDGHTASLFPGSAALAEKHLWVTGVPHNQPPEPLVARVTLTLPVLQAAHQVIFLVAGEDKAHRLAEVLAPATGEPLPAQLAAPRDGKLLWMVDREAVAGLELAE